MTNSSNGRPKRDDQAAEPRDAFERLAEEIGRILGAALAKEGRPQPESEFEQEFDPSNPEQPPE